MLSYRSLPNATYGLHRKLEWPQWLMLWAQNRLSASPLLACRLQQASRRASTQLPMPFQPSAFSKGNTCLVPCTIQGTRMPPFMWILGKQNAISKLELNQDIRINTSLTKWVTGSLMTGSLFYSLYERSKLQLNDHVNHSVFYAMVSQFKLVRGILKPPGGCLFIYLFSHDTCQASRRAGL